VKHKVSFRPAAEDDLFELYHYIASEAGLAIAGEYVERIEAACLGLENFPLLGRARDDIRPGLRTLGFERRAVIVYRIVGREVVIVRVFHGGQDFERTLLAQAGE
jgi:toxin ParE1/3/4